jgi:putative endonuclease
LQFTVYILENPQGQLYVGQTDDLSQRLQDHNSPIKIGRKFTHKNGPWKLVWSEPHPTRAEAMARERQIKSMKSSRWIRQNLLGQVERVPARRD